MNFLAHLHLSTSNEWLILGNFLGDFVHKKQAEELPIPIQEGISLHRFIDDFTDSHEVAIRTKKRIRPTFGKYAPVLADIYYDYCLALSWQSYEPEVSLQIFATNAIQILKKHDAFLPLQAKRFITYAETNNIFVQYGNLSGIDLVLQGMAKRASFKSNMEFGAHFLAENQAQILLDFQEFYPQLQTACNHFLEGDRTFGHS